MNFLLTDTIPTLFTGKETLLSLQIKLNELHLKGNEFSIYQNDQKKTLAIPLFVFCLIGKH